MDEALIVSIVSLVLSVLLSIGLAIWQIFTTIKINKVNLKSNVCEKIYDDYLIKEIPIGRKYLKFDGKGLLTGTKYLIDVIRKMQKDSLYYRYNDESFYNDLDKELHDLEDLLVKSNGKKLDSIKQNDFYNDIEEILKKIYKKISEKKING